MPGKVWNLQKKALKNGYFLNYKGNCVCLLTCLHLSFIDNYYKYFTGHIKCMGSYGNGRKRL